MKDYLFKTSLCFLCLTMFVACSNESPKTNEEAIVEHIEAAIEEDVRVEVDGPFTVQSGVVNYEMKKLDGSVTATLVFYFDEYGNRLRLEETMDGETSVYMYDENQNKGLTIFPGRDPSKISMRQGELNMLVAMHSTSGYTQQNDEMVAEKSCTVYANNAMSAEGESQHMYYKHQGLLLKEVNRLGGGYILEAVSFETQALDENIYAELNDLK